MRHCDQVCWMEINDIVREMERYGAAI
jgi:hypothetical protein